MTICPKCGKGVVPVLDAPAPLIAHLVAGWHSYECEDRYGCGWVSRPGWGHTQEEADADRDTPGNARLLDGTKVTVPDLPDDLGANCGFDGLPTVLRVAR